MVYTTKKETWDTLSTAYTYTDLDLQKQATEEQINWLRTRPVLWYRCLRSRKILIERTVHTARLQLASRAPKGTPPSVDYLKAKAAHDETRSRRKHMLTRIDSKISDVLYVLNAQTLADVTTKGDIIGLLVNIDYLVKTGKYDVVKEVVQNAMARLNSPVG
jgi:hypothetical protein